MPRVLLIRPLCEGRDPEFGEPLGIERLAGYLGAHGIAAELLDRRLYAAERRAGLATDGAAGFWDDVRSLCAHGDEPQVIGFSLMTEGDVPDARRIASRLHARYPHATIAFGGVFVTTAAARARQLLPHDAVLLRGEGEAALLALARGDEAARGYVTPNEWACPHRPYLERYARLGCAVAMQTSRGCPGICTFCATPQLPQELRRWQGRALDLVASEMAQVAARLEAADLPPVLNIVDDDAGPLSRLEALAGELRRQDLRVAWACEMRMAALVRQPDLAGRLRALHEAGLTRLFVGVESLDAATLRAWKKHYDVSCLPEVLDAARTAGIAVQTGYMLWHANQTVAGALGEVHRLHELGIYTHQAAISRLIVFLGSELGRTLGQAAAYQPMGAREETFYQRFCERTQELRERWVGAAIREPYAAAQAFLGEDASQLTAVREELASVNEESYAQFLACHDEFVRMAGDDGGCP
ncbi:MAG: cobalamin-dependent protein [Coriobacteriales bacterium]|nr:cobalamin-dependent protein [Coriobacteriales bacterium]